MENEIRTSKPEKSRSAILKEFLTKERCLICGNFCDDLYCCAIRRNITEEEAQGKPCEADDSDLSRFEPILSAYQVDALGKANHAFEKVLLREMVRSP